MSQKKHRQVGWLLAGFAAVLSSAPVLGQGVGQAAGGIEPTLAQLLVAGTPSERSKAARLLLVDSTPEDQREVVVASVRKGLADPAGAEVIAAAGKAQTLPAWVEPPLLELARQAGEADFAPLARALAQLRSLEAANVLHAMAGRAQKVESRGAAIDGLVMLTGRDDLGLDAARWGAWLAEASAWPAEKWHGEICAYQAARAERQSAARASAVRRLIESQRQLHLATAAGDRPKLLAGMLGDELDEIRRLGIELIGRELAAGQKMDAVVEQAAIDLLANADPVVRTEAAGLLNQLAPDRAAGTVSATLDREQDPRAAAALLRLASRWPGAALLESSARWLEPAPEKAAWPAVWMRQARSAAVEACWALSKAGYLNEADERTRVLRAVREIPAAELTPTGCLLRGGIGTSWDREEIAKLLTGPDPAQRIGAGEALVGWAEFLDAILQAAKLDPQLIETAARGVILHRPTVAGFEAIAALKFPLPQAKRESLTRVATMLPATDALAAAESVKDDPAAREAVLGTLARRERILSERADPANLRAIAQGVTELAKVRLAAGKPSEALSAMDALPDLADVRGVDETRPLRLKALVMANKLEDADALEAPAAEWLDALEASMDRPHALTVVTRIANKFEGTLPEELKTRLSALRERLAQADKKNDSGG